MYAIKINNEIKIYNELPEVWNNTLGFRDSATTEEIYNAGFRDLIVPVITNKQKFGSIYFDVENDCYTYEVIDFTAEEIAEKLASIKNEIVLLFEFQTDEIIKAVVGNRESEYLIAEKEANEFKNAGYPDNDVPFSVSSDAIANNRTNKEACDLILLMSHNWREIQKALRGKRLLCKSNVKKAKSVEEVKLIEEDWKLFIDNIKKQIVE